MDNLLKVSETKDSGFQKPSDISETTLLKDDKQKFEKSLKVNTGSFTSKSNLPKINYT